MRRKRQTSVRAFALGCTMLLPHAVSAQTAAQAGDPAVPTSADTIVITAQRFEQRIQDVPLSVTAVTAEALQARGVSSLSEMQYAVPGLSSYRYGPGTENIQLRGTSTSIGAPTVGIYLDELPVALDQQGTGIDVPLLDVARVEVLRGPQATLYGEGSMGGTIRYITAEPDMNEVSGSAFGEASGTRDGAANFRVEGIVNVPIVSGKLAARFAGGYERIGGWIDNPVRGIADANRSTLKTFRGKIRAEMTDDTSFSLMVQHRDIDQDALDFGNDRITFAILPAFSRSNNTIVQGVIVHDFAVASLSLIGGYVKNSSSSQYDVSAFYVPFLTAPPPFGFGLPVGFITGVGIVGDSRTTMWSGEARLQSRGDSPLRWIVGAEYRDLDGESVSSAPTSPNPSPVAIFTSTGERSSKTFAAYGEASYAVTPELTLLAGLRYFNNLKAQNVSSASFGFPTTDIGRARFTSVNPRFNATYAFNENSMVYANVAKGFRSGGFNNTSAGGGVFIIPPTYAPDSIWTYEAGTKHQLFDNRLSFDVAVYRSQWKDVQSYSFAPGSSLTVVLNSGQVAGWGVDASISARPVQGLTLSGTFGWNNLAYTADTADKLKGDPVDAAVRKSWSASADYRTSLSDKIEGFLRADYQHAGRAQISLRNFGNQVIDRPSRNLVNLRAGVNISNVELALFATNVFDESAPNIVGPFGVLLENLEQRPRQLGGSVRFIF